MKYTPSIAFEEFAGSAKGVTAAKSRGRKYIRNKGYGNPSNTTFQSDTKAIFSQLTKSFKALTSEQIISWNALAQTQEGRSTLGSKSKISGLNLYLRLNYWVVACGGTAKDTPPSLWEWMLLPKPRCPYRQCFFTLTLAASAFITNLKLIVKASMPQSNGISDAYAKATVIGDPQILRNGHRSQSRLRCRTKPQHSRPKVFRNGSMSTP